MFVQVPREAFAKRWVCSVIRSGHHNGSPCTQDDPHGDPWRCEARFEVSVPAKVFNGWEKVFNSREKAES